MDDRLVRILEDGLGNLYSAFQANLGEIPVSAEESQLVFDCDTKVYIITMILIKEGIWLRISVKMASSVVSLITKLSKSANLSPARVKSSGTFLFLY